MTTPSVSSHRIWLASVLGVGAAFLIYRGWKAEKERIQERPTPKEPEAPSADRSKVFVESEHVSKDSEFVIFDLETTIPATDILEFGGMIVDKHGLFLKSQWETLVFSSKVTKRSTEANGITQEMLKGMQ